MPKNDLHQSVYNYVNLEIYTDTICFAFFFYSFFIYPYDERRECIMVVGGPRTRVPSPKINLPGQANKRNQTPRITLTRGALKNQMAADTSKN